MSIATDIAAIVGSIVSVVTLVRVGKVKKELVTLNESTLGQLGAATETRRIEEIPEANRTAKEVRHMDQA